MRILFFNPENDLALAANDPHYTPPASARKMAEDLQRLPLRWALPEDFVLLRDGTFINARGTVVANVPFTDCCCLPWGWSPLMVETFRRSGVPPALLPSATQLETFRKLAGRATVADLLPRLLKRLSEAGFNKTITGEAHVCTTLDEARRFHTFFGETIFKQPWSGSGRGLLPVHRGCLTDKNESWLLRTIRQQGYVMAEPRYERLLDFAVEFWRDTNGNISYQGLSLFQTTAGGVYAGNLVTSEDVKRRCLAPFCEPSLLDETILALQAELESLPSTFYVGPLGVDLMIVKKDNSNMLHPCVEINFRMTMGWVALNV